MPDARRACGPPASWAPSRERPGSPAQAIGSIDLYDRFAFVEVPDDSVETVLAGWLIWRSRARRRHTAPKGRDRVA